MKVGITEVWGLKFEVIGVWNHWSLKSLELLTSAVIEVQSYWSLKFEANEVWSHRSLKLLEFEIIGIRIHWSLEFEVIEVWIYWNLEFEVSEVWDH